MEDGSNYWLSNPYELWAAQSHIEADMILISISFNSWSIVEIVGVALIIFGSTNKKEHGGALEAYVFDWIPVLSAFSFPCFTHWQQVHSIPFSHSWGHK